MSCFSPLHAISKGLNSNGKKNIYFPKTQFEYDNLSKIFEPIEIPCGKCVGCRLANSRMWANRCLIESKEYSNNYFVTLTYSDDNLTFVKSLNAQTGEVQKRPTLVKKDMQKFMKDLRRYMSYHFGIDNIRFFGCGEYGTKKSRPHFHMILFNCPLNDLKYFFTNKAGDKIYRSEIIEKVWNKGLCSVGEVTWNSIAYTARYVMKKQKGKTSGFVLNEESDLTYGLVPEFMNCSRSPGIARKFFEDNKHEIYQTDEIILSDGKRKVLKIKPPKYYDDLYDLENHAVIESIKKSRKELAEYNLALQLERTDLSKEEYLALKRRAKESQICRLLRSID